MPKEINVESVFLSISEFMLFLSHIICFLSRRKYMHKNCGPFEAKNITLKHIFSNVCIILNLNEILLPK